MSGQLFISLLNPGIGLLFATAFLLLWLNRRERYVAYAAGAYFTTAFAFVMQDVVPAMPMELQRLPANAGFLATGMLFAAAIVKRYGLPVPWRAMAGPAAMISTQPWLPQWQRSPTGSTQMWPTSPAEPLVPR